MITLITGVPGASKTLNTIKHVRDSHADRKIYYRAIKELSLDWCELSDDQVLSWTDLPDGSVLVIDEAQQVWPNIANNQKSPLSVMALDTHRHRGFDFYVITQKATMVDFRLRGFVGRHWHFERAFGQNRVRRLEWQKAISDVDDYHTRQTAETSSIKIDPAIFNLYKSAELHTVKKTIPKMAYVAIVALVFTFGAFGYLYYSISDRTQEADLVQAEVLSPESNFDALQKFSPLGGGSGGEVMSTQQYLDKFTPRVPDIPSSAPAYDAVAEVVAIPRPQCIYSYKRNECRCYTQQATSLDISHQACLNYIENGWFNPYKADGEAGGGGDASFSASAQPEDTLPQTDPVAGGRRVIVADSSEELQPDRISGPVERAEFPL